MADDTVPFTLKISPKMVGQLQENGVEGKRVITINGCVHHGVAILVCVPDSDDKLRQLAKGGDLMECIISQLGQATGYLVAQAAIAGGAAPGGMH